MCVWFTMNNGIHFHPFLTQSYNMSRDTAYKVYGLLLYSVLSESWQPLIIVNLESLTWHGQIMLFYHILYGCFIIGQRNAYNSDGSTIWALNHRALVYNHHRTQTRPLKLPIYYGNGAVGLEDVPHWTVCGMQFVCVCVCVCVCRSESRTSKAGG